MLKPYLRLHHKFLFWSLSLLSPPASSFVAPLRALFLHRPSPTAPHMVPQPCHHGTAHGSAQSGLGQGPPITILKAPSGSFPAMALLPLQPSPAHDPCPDPATSHGGLCRQPCSRSAGKVSDVQDNFREDICPCAKRTYYHQDAFGVSNCHWPCKVSLQVLQCLSAVVPRDLHSIVLGWGFHFS